MTTIDQQTALVTGANRGLGKEFVKQLLDRGARKVYATARDASTIDASDPRVVALELDVTDVGSVRRAAEVATDVTVVVNNAGIADSRSLLDPDQSALRRELETNFFGPLNVTTAFADQLAARGGALLNVHSVLSWIGLGDSYSASKAAVWSATNSVRLELAPRGVQVVGLHVGYIDTDMTEGIDAPKTAPDVVVREALDGLERGDLEVLADELTRQVKAGLSAPVEAMYPQLATQPA